MPQPVPVCVVPRVGLVTLPSARHQLSCVRPIKGLPTKGVIFYDRTTQGGIEEPLPDGRGARTIFSDKTMITMREVSPSDGSLAVGSAILGSSDSGGIKR